MEHGDYRVQLLDETGQVIGSKPRREIDKHTDIVHCVDIFLFNEGGELVLGVIPDGDAIAPGTYAPPAATMLRESEREEEAAARALKKELGIEGEELHPLGAHFFTYANGVKRKKTSFWVQTAADLQPNPEDVASLKAFTREELQTERTHQPKCFHELFEKLWQAHQDQLPF